MKKIILTLSLCAFVLSWSGFTLPSQAYAGHGGGGYSKHGCSYKGGHGSSGGGCPITGKFFKKAHMLLENQQDLGLNDQQVADIKALKLEMKKNGIKQMADNQIFMLDIEQRLSETTVDVETLGGLIDSHAQAMAAAAKGNIAAYAKLKGMITAEQWSKMKELWHSHKAR